VVRTLLERGDRPVVLDDLSAPSPQTVPLRNEMETVVVDVRDRVALGAEMHRLQPRAVVHLAARHFLPSCLADARGTYDVNVGGLAAVLDACRATPPEVVVFASSAAVYRPSLTPHDERSPVGPIDVYGASKLVGERMLQRFAAEAPDTSVAIARLCNVYGPGDPHPHALASLMEQLRGSDALRVGNPDSRRDFVFVDDVAATVVALLAHQGAPLTVNVGTGRAVSVRELVQMLARTTERPLRMVVDPARCRRQDRPNLAVRATSAAITGVRLRRLETALDAWVRAGGAGG
jgi:UDP-glucose 4-epimerase